MLSNADDITRVIVKTGGQALVIDASFLSDEYKRRFGCLIKHPMFDTFKPGTSLLVHLKVVLDLNDVEQTLAVSSPSGTCTFSA